MARTGAKYWEAEKPVIVNISRLEVRYFPKAGVIQFYNRLPDKGGEGEGRISKGVTLHIDALNLDELGQLDNTFQTIVAMEKRARATMKPKAATEPVTKGRTFDDVAREMAGTGLAEVAGG